MLYSSWTIEEASDDDLHELIRTIAFRMFILSHV